jgi:hypothetical protein
MGFTEKKQHIKTAKKKAMFQWILETLGAFSPHFMVVFHGENDASWFISGWIQETLGGWNKVARATIQIRFR